MYSMTAFARTQGVATGLNWTWEIKSVNHRFLDQFYRLPEASRRLEPQLRQVVQQHLKRGRVEIFLQMKRDEGQSLHNINAALLKQLVQMSEKISSEFQIANDLTVSRCLSWPNMFQDTEQQEDTFYPLLLQSFQEAITQLIQSRSQEGLAIEQMLRDRIEKIQYAVQVIKNHKDTQLPAFREKMAKKMAMMQAENVDNTRVEQELAILLMRLDIAEEIDRLNAHLHEMKRVFEAGDAQGRRLDFLIQELHRETNTIGSKTESKEISQIVIDMKVLIEQMREQIQNVE